MGVDVRLSQTALDTLGNLETRSKDRILSKLDDVADFPGHYLDRLANVPGYKLRGGDLRIVVDWDREEDVIYVVDVLERKHDYRELSGLGEVWGRWRE